jgi:hypothetical protein
LFNPKRLVQRQEIMPLGWHQLPFDGHFDVTARRNFAVLNSMIFD